MKTPQQNIWALELEQEGLRVYFTPSGTGSVSSEEFAYYGHSHPYYELHLLCRGNLNMRIDTRNFSMEPGSFCLITPGTDHAPASSVSGVQRFCLGLEPLRSPKPVAKQLLCATVGQAKAALPIAAQLQALDITLPFAMETAYHLLAQLVICLAQTLCGPSQAGPESTTLDSRRTVGIDDYLNNRFHLPGGADRLAGELGVSTRQLDRIFHRLYSMNFRDKLLQVRLDAACDLLRSELTIGQIAQMTGYSSTANFSAFFKRATNLTPTAYRKQISHDL